MAFLFHHSEQMIGKIDTVIYHTHIKMSKKLFFLLFTFLVSGSASKAQEILDTYNIVWNKQSENSSESMPLGGGDIGLNVWVEDGDVLFYIAQSGTFDENNSMPKLGRVRLEFNPNPFVGEGFKQELHLRDGFVTVEGNNKGVSGSLKLWVDVFSPTVHMEFKSKEATEMKAVYESWRTEDRVQRKFENFQNSYKWVNPKGLITKADHVLFDGNSVLFYHRNMGETMFDVVVEQQQMNDVKDKMFNPLDNLTFGGELSGKGMIPAGNTEGIHQTTAYKGFVLKSEKAVKSQNIKLVLNTNQTETLDAWKKELTSNKEKSNRKKADKETQEWWNDLWDRSYVLIQPNNKDENSEHWQAGRNYQLFRYMLACNAYGSYPTKFNGGLFTYDPLFTNKDRDFTPDYRNWGGGTFTAQNQRLVYFPMLKNGDFDFLPSQLDFYDRIKGNAELRSRHYWGHEGACFVEQIENFGLPNPSEYGWKRPEGYDDGLQYNVWLEHQWDTALEFCFMALESRRYSGADISKYIPLITSTLKFFDEHYQKRAFDRGSKKLDTNGDLVLYPGSSCETYKMAYNATSTIAALQVVSEELLKLPSNYISKIDTAYFSELRDRIPPIEAREIDGHEMIAPAKLWERVNNTEEPQLYPIYPWGIYGVGKSDIELALNTWNYDPDCLKFRSHVGWKQDAIFAARLGLTAQADSLMRLKLRDADTRFPAFWGPGFDWTPDHNWGGSGMIAVQEMLVQDVDGKIFLFPAWDKNVDVHFKLHLPDKTTVEASLKGGNIEDLIVLPKSREKDIVNCIK